MARFHVYFCEINTAIDHWRVVEGREERKMKEEEEGRKEEEGRGRGGGGEEEEGQGGGGEEVKADEFIFRSKSIIWAGVWKDCYPER